MTISNIIEHFENHLGTIHKGWGQPDEIKVLQFLDCPSTGVTTYATLGLGDHSLWMDDGRSVRLELVVSVYDKYNEIHISSFLISFSEYIVQRHQALLRGDVVGPSAPLIEGVEANAVYASIPVFFNEDFASFEGTEPQTIIVWLVPLRAQDAEYVKANGWQDFETLLEQTEIDFWNLDRAPIVPPS